MQDNGTEMTDFEKTILNDAPAAADPESLPAEWEHLNQVPAGGTVDLSGVWEVLHRRPPGVVTVQQRRGQDLLSLLERKISNHHGRAWTLAYRLNQVVDHMWSADDDRVCVDLEDSGDHTMVVTAWTETWEPGQLPWHISLEVETELNERGRMRTRALGPVTLVTSDWEENSGTVTYVDGPDGALAPVLISYVQAWFGRLAWQQQTGWADPWDGRYDDEGGSGVPSAEEFAARLS
jgi:hypothetical protein